MQLVEINKIGAQTPERVFAGFADVLRFAVRGYREFTRILVVLLWIRHRESTFGSQDDPMTITLKRFAHQFLVGEWPVDIGGIEECDTELHSAPNRGDGFRAISTSVGPSHRHTTKPNRAN